MTSSLDADISATLSTIWCDILQLSEIGQDDDFIALGGDSLLAMEMTFRVVAEFRINHRDDIIFGIDEGTTLRELRKIIAEEISQRFGQ
jgi:acyl carrier protein